MHDSECDYLLFKGYLSEKVLNVFGPIVFQARFA